MELQKQADLIAYIIKIEWEMFSKVENLNGRASCQENWPTFQIMRNALYLAWSEDMITSYIHDLTDAVQGGRNLIAEKYAYMMKDTDPEYYTTKLEPQLPKADAEKTALVTGITALVVEFEQEFAQKYPYLAAKSRPIHTENAGADTSSETYTRGELLTYSNETLKHYFSHLASCRMKGINFSELIREQMVKSYGYASLTDAEEKHKPAVTQKEAVPPFPMIPEKESAPTPKDFFAQLDAFLKNGRLQDAEKLAREEMQRAQTHGDLPALLAAANELGGIYRVTNRFAEAIQTYAAAEGAIKLMKMENSLPHATTILNLASVHSEAGEYAQALRLYEKTAAIYKAAGLEKDYRLAALYNNISHTFEQLDVPNSAIDYAKRSVAVISSLPGNEVELGTSLTSLGSRYLKQKNYPEALSNLKQAEQIFLSLPGRVNVHFAATLNSLAELHYRNGKVAEAIECYERALQILKENYGENKAYQEVKKNLDSVRGAQVHSVKSPLPASSSPTARMKGMDLSHAFWQECGRPMLERDFASYCNQMAVGLVGEGSECYGYDDALSEDHDFGPGFCIWLPDTLFAEIGTRLAAAYEQLPKTFRGKTRMETLEGKGRVGVFPIGDFYRRYIGCSGVPKSPVEWMLAPETGLATVTNGMIFHDPSGQFTAIQNELLRYYPEDVRNKKIAAKMALLSQSGQYNYGRCMKRGDYLAANVSCAEFVKAAVSLAHLLNRRYMPFYKWMFRSLEDLKRLSEVKLFLQKITALTDVPTNTTSKLALIEEVCILFRDELLRQNLINGSDPFLSNHSHHVMSLIQEEKIRNLPVLYDGR